jgi:hypothetical protein
MKMFLLGALFAWFAVSFIEEYTHICGVLEFPMIVMNVVLEIIIFPFVLFWCIFLRHTIKSVTPAQVEKAKLMEDSKHLFGSVYICFDKKAKRFCNKVFLFRVKWLEQDNIPSSPEGNFRIGVDN